MIDCYETYRQLSVMLGQQFSPQEIEAALTVADREFMSPNVDYLTADEALEYTGEDESGWYWRLSASGYLDCTDWAGPFDTELDAIADMLSTYGDDWVPASMDDWRESLEEEA